MTSESGVKKLIIYPFAYESIEERLPEDAKLLNRLHPVFALSKKQLANLLDSSSKMEPKDSQSRKDMEAVLKYLLESNPLIFGNMAPEGKPEKVD